MNILVTGATGFVGHHVARAFAEDGHRVHALVREDSDTSALTRGPGSLAVHRCAGTMGEVDAIVAAATPELIVHLAASVRAEHRMTDVDAMIAANVLLGTQLLESALRRGVRHVINTGSYWQRYQANGYCPTSLYAATKQAFEDILAYYRDRAGLRALTIELFDAYGPGDRRTKLFNLLARAAATGEVLEMTEGRQMIDLVHIDDIATAYRVAADLLLSHRIIDAPFRYSVCTGRPICLRDVVALYRRISGQDIRIAWGAKAYRYRQIMIPAPGLRLPGWQPSVDLESGIGTLLAAGQGPC